MSLVYVSPKRCSANLKNTEAKYDERVTGHIMKDISLPCVADIIMKQVNERFADKCTTCMVSASWALAQLY